MDGTKFNLSSNAVDLTDEVISLVSRMYFGKRNTMVNGLMKINSYELQRVLNRIVLAFIVNLDLITFHN